MGVSAAADADDGLARIGSHSRTLSKRSSGETSSSVSATSGPNDEETVLVTAMSLLNSEESTL